MASSSQIPFAPLGDTITFAAATPTPPTALQAPIRPTINSDAGQYRIINDSTVTVFLGVGATSAEAIANAGVQRSIDDATWTDVDTFTSISENVGYEPELLYYRAGCKTGEFTGGNNITIRFGSKWVSLT